MGFTGFAVRLSFVVFATFLLPSLVAQEKLPPQKPSPKPISESGQKSGYVWADNPISSQYTPSPIYSFNSSGGKITIVRSDVGKYSVFFAGLGGRGGNALVTAYGPGSEACKIQGFGSDQKDSTTFVVNVFCFDLNGKAIDTTYTARVMWTDATFGKHGYTWADNPTHPSYLPSRLYSHNSSGGPIRVERTDIGSYHVRFTGLGGRGLAGGNVLVTAYGGGNETCKVVYWDSGGADFIAGVRCFDGNAKAADSQFTINVVW